MSINTDYSKNVNQNVNAAGSAVQTSSAKSQEKPVIVFENNEDINKKNKKLNAKELKYLLANGYDVTKMSAAEIQEALVPLYTEKSEETQKTSTENAAEVQTSDKSAFTAPQAASQADKEVSAQQAQTKSVQTNDSQAAVSVNNQAPAQQANNEVSKNSYPTEIEIDFDDKDLKQMGFTPDDVGIYACDFEELSKEEQENFLVTAFAKKHFGENWDNMQPEAQAKILQSIDSQLAEKIPSWKSLTQQEKATLGYSFLTGSEAEDEYRYRGDTNSHSDKVAVMSFDNQIEHTAHNIMRVSYDEKIEKLHTNKDDHVSDVQYKYLDDKVKKSGVDCLNVVERREYGILSQAKKISGDQSIGKVLGELNPDKETSTFAIMQKNEHYNEIYHKVFEETKDAEAAEKAATADWFIHQFEGIDENDKEAIGKKYIELKSNCSTHEEQLRLASLANEIRIAVADGGDAILRHIHSSESGDAHKQVVTAESIAEAHKKGKVGDDIVAGIAKDIPDSYKQEAVAGSTIALTRVSKKAAAAVVDNTKEGKYTVAQQKEIFEDPVKNPDLQTDKESTNILGKGIGHTDSSIQIVLNKKYTEYAVENKDTGLMKSITEGLSDYSKENQTPAFKNIMLSSEKFDDNDAISIQKTLANQIAKSDKSNQLEMHSDIMKSKFSEVQEQAAQNIKNYDHSIQNEAIDKVYESKNTKAIQAVLDNLDKMPPQVQKTESARLIGEIALNGAVESGLLESKIMGGSLSARELMQLTPTQRREYFIKQFEDASPTKKLEILKKLASASSGVYKKTIYTIIARFSSPLLKSMVEGGLGKSMLDAGLPIDAVNKIINVMKTSTNNDVIEQLKELKLDASFEKYFDEKDEADMSDKKSVTIPPEFGNDVKKIFAKKGNKGNALMDIKS